MPLPTTVTEFVELVRKSGVIDEKSLHAHLEKLRAASALPSQPGQLAGLLVRDGILTHFQANQFMQGKWKRFTIGKYKVLEQLGSGGMGSVYLCEHILMRRRVAVKVLPATKADDPAALDRFYREARAVAALDHPNIVRAYDIDQAEKLHFLVMEYVDGSSLQEIIKRTGPMDVTRACHYIRQAALGLQHAHEAAGLVHRDIKPGNILVDRNGIVKVLDMGLARFFHDDETTITKKYDESVLGTADYLAPEQAVDSHDADIRADIYSLGATFYFCLTGRTPFQEGTVAQKLIWHQTRQPKPIRQTRPDVDEALAAVLEKMMAKRRDDRYQTPLAVAEALAPWTKTQIPPPPDTEMPRLSPAATSGTPGSSGNASTSTGSDSGLRTNARPATAPSPPPRKNWQVSGTPPPPSSQPATERPAPPKSPSDPQARTVPAVVPAPAAAPAARPGPAASTPGPAARPTPAVVPAPAAAPQAAPSPHAVRPAAASVLPAPAPPKNSTAPPPAAVTAAEEEAPRASLAADPHDTTSQLDTDRAAGGRARLDQSREAAQARRRLFVILGIIGAVVLVLSIIGVWLALRGKPSDTGKKTEPESTIHHVGRDGDFNTIAEALDHAKSGDRIVVRADVVRDWLSLAADRRSEEHTSELQSLRHLVCRLL